VGDARVSPAERGELELLRLLLQLRQVLEEHQREGPARHTRRDEPRAHQAAAVRKLYVDAPAALAPAPGREAACASSSEKTLHLAQLGTTLPSKSEARGLCRCTNAV